MKWLRPKNVRGTTALDVILKAFLKNDLDSLSEENQAILERITEVDARIRKGYVVTEPRVASLTGAVYEHNYTRPYRKQELAQWQMSRFNISMSQAYRDIEMAERFFLTTEKRPDKEFARGMMIHWGEDAMAKAQADGDHRAAAAFYRELTKIKGLDKEDEPGFDPEKFMPIEPIIVSDPSELGFEKIENPDAVVARLQKELRQTKMMERIFRNESENVEFENSEDHTDE